MLGAKAKGVAKQVALGSRKRRSKEIARELGKRGWAEEGVSSRTVRRQLRQGSTRALRYKTQKRAQRITAQQQATRLEWARSVKGQPASHWERVMFSDSHVFRMHSATRGRKMWCIPGKELVMTTDKHPSQVHAYGGVTWYGTTELHFVSGTTGLRSMTKGVRAREY